MKRAILIAVVLGAAILAPRFEQQAYAANSYELNRVAYYYDSANVLVGTQLRACDGSYYLWGTQTSNVVREISECEPLTFSAPTGDPGCYYIYNYTPFTGELKILFTSCP